MADFKNYQLVGKNPYSMPNENGTLNQGWVLHLLCQDEMYTPLGEEPRGYEVVSATLKKGEYPEVENALRLGDIFQCKIHTERAKYGGYKKQFLDVIRIPIIKE